MIRFGNEISLEIHQKVQALSRFLDKNKLPGVIEYVPAYTNVTVYYDCYQVATQITNSNIQSPYERMAKILEEAIKKLDVTTIEKPEIVEIPVCYGGEFGPDLEFVAKYNHLSTEEVIHIHSNGQYLTYMIGFAPGFPYLGGLSEKLATPRREAPRLEIPAGAVGIAGNQTGIYPISTPGGWQLIGRTPIRLFRPEKEIPTLLKPGNIIKFKPISYKRYQQLLEGNC